MTKRSFTTDALILMFAGLIVKILGFFYRIYLSNLLMAEGMGVRELITPLYSLIIITISSGISITVSGLVSYESAKKNLANLKRITNTAVILAFIASSIVSTLLYIFLKDIVTYFLKDQRTLLPLLVFIPSLPFITLSSAIKGYFYGTSNVTPTAIANIVEQIVRIAGVLFLLNNMRFFSISHALALTMVGTIISEIASLLILFIFYKKNTSSTNACYTLSIKKIVLKILSLSSSISFNKLITSILSTIETIYIPSRLVLSGLSWTQSVESLGKLSGMAMPLILFPSIVTNSLSTTLIPAISEGLATNNYKSINLKISKSICLTSSLGFIFMITFMTFSHQISSLIYKTTDISSILYLLSFTSILLYLNQILQGILNGLNEQTFSLISSTICYGIRILFVFFVIPKYGISGFILGLILALSISFVLNLIVILKRTSLIIDLKNWIFKPSIVSIIMLIINKYILSFFSILKLNTSLHTIVSVGTSIMIACFLMSLLNLANEARI
ncbi:MAG: oligosaccharide flippase family protein [Clostridiales bacterium]|nr:oligosaccharide flippase family protein [Clostridiales bacterium]